MNHIDGDFISAGFSEVHKTMGFPAMFYKSTSVKDRFNQQRVILVPASDIVYAVFAPEEMKDPDLVQDSMDGSPKDKAIIKVVRRDLINVGMPKVETKDVVELELNGEKIKYIISGRLNKGELPNLFSRFRITLMDDLNVREI